MYRRLQWFIRLWVQGLSKGDVHCAPHLRSLWGVWPALPFTTWIWCLCWTWPCSNFAEIFGIKKLESLGYHVTLFAWMFSSFETIPACDRQMDGQTHDDGIYYTSIAHMVKMTWAVHTKLVTHILYGRSLACIDPEVKVASWSVLPSWVCMLIWLLRFLVACWYIYYIWWVYPISGPWLLECCWFLNITIVVTSAKFEICTTFYSEVFW